MSHTKITVAYFSDATQLTLKIKGKKTFSVSLARRCTPPSEFYETVFFHFKKTEKEAQEAFDYYVSQRQNILEKIISL